MQPKCSYSYQIHYTGWIHKSVIENTNTQNPFQSRILREGKALYDNLYPSRIIVGVDMANEELKNLPRLLQRHLQTVQLRKHRHSLYGLHRGRSGKAFCKYIPCNACQLFNELDTYAEMKNLNTKSIIDGVCLDPRIGNHYNNPSFGYGGYCLPKDTNSSRPIFGCSERHNQRCCNI